MKLKLQFHSAYLIWLPSGVDDGYQLTQKQAGGGGGGYKYRQYILAQI